MKNHKDTIAGIGFPIVGFSAAVGACLGEWIGNADTSQAGGFLGAAVGVTLWLVIAAMIDRNWNVLAANVSIVGGMWVGYFVGGFDKILPGALWGSAVLVGFLLARVVDHYHVRSLMTADEVA